MDTRQDRADVVGAGAHGASAAVDAAPVPETVVERLERELDARGGGFVPAAAREGSVGVTLFDTPASDDATVTIVLPPDQLDRVPNRAFVRIADDGETPRRYVGLVTAGPFCEPDGLRGDAPLIVTTAARGARMFVPRYHGRAEVEIVGEEGRGGLRPPRFRPRPNSPVFVLAREEVAAFLNAGGDIQLGLAVGYEGIAVGIPSDQKLVLPRHLGVLGTTGGGKSTTVSRLIREARAAGLAVVVIDVEGEYTFIHEPTEDPTMRALLEERGLEPGGVPRDRVHLYHLVGREAANEEHPDRRPFSLAFDALSPHAVTEILEMNDAQEERFFKAYDTAVEAMTQFGLLDRRQLLDWDPLERGCPGLTLAMLYDMVQGFAEKVQTKSLTTFAPAAPGFAARGDDLGALLEGAQHPGHAGSWRKVQGQLGQLKRLNIFDNARAAALDGRALVRPGHVSLIDLSDTDSTYQRNLAIAEVLRTVQLAQEEAVGALTDGGAAPPRTLVIIEEAHEFISAQRVKQMPVLFGQIARIARRGRKRWLGLCFVTQTPQHLPSEILGLVNNVILHRLSDAGTIAELRRAFGNVDEGLWRRLSGLAPGQALVALASLTRPLLVAIDPTPCKLRLVE